ncbi:hypothetical protein [Desulforhopalus sp. 52FAK]
MVEAPEKESNNTPAEEKDNIIVEIFKKLLEINFSTYGGKKNVLK